MTVRGRLPAFLFLPLCVAFLLVFYKLSADQAERSVVDAASPAPVAAPAAEGAGAEPDAEIDPAAEPETPAVGDAREPALATSSTRGAVAAAEPPAPTFEVAGRVALADGARLPEDAAVRFGFARGEEREWADPVPVNADGTYGPARVPVLGGEGLIGVVEGKGLLGEPRAFRLPRLDQRLVADFDVRRGDTYRVRVTDLEARPLDGATVYLWWEGDEADEVTGRTASDGELSLTAPPGVAAYVDVFRRDYATVSSAGPFAAEDAAEGPIEIALAPGGTLHGRCVSAAGEPVPAFDLMIWRTDPADGSWLTFADENGEFELDGVPLGPITLLAFAPGFAQSEPAAVDVAADRPGKVELVLPATRTGDATVVDGRSRRPIAGARAQLYARYGTQAVVPLGDAVETDAEGGFELDGFGPHGAAVEVAAPGYATQYRIHAGGSAERIELGTIALVPTTQVELRLLAEAGRDPSEYRLWTEKGDLAPTAFPADGVLRAELRADAYHFLLRRPDGTTRVVAARVEPGPPVAIELDASGARALDVQLRDHAGADLGGARVRAGFLTGGGFAAHEEAPLDEGHRARLRDVEGESVVLELLARDGAVLVTESFALAGAPVQEVELRVAGHTARVRVVDPEGNPIAGATATARLAGFDGDAPFWTRTRVADANGELVLGPFTRPRVRVDLSHPDHGRVFAQEVLLATGSVAELVLDARASLKLRLVDGATPLDGVDVRVYHEPGGVFVAGRSSGSDGRVELAGVAVGTYALVVQQDGYWRTELEAEADLGAGFRDVQVRRLGTADVALRSADGAPLAGVPVELTSVEFGETWSDWVAAGRAPAPVQGFLTDARGGIRAADLPRGDYVLRAALPGGEVVERTIPVAPGAPTASLVQVP